METLERKLPGGIRVGLKVEGQDVCPIHKVSPCECDQAPDVYELDMPDDLTTKQFAQLIQINGLALASASMKDTAGASHTETANTAVSSPTILAGTDTTAAAFTDFALNAQTESAAASVNAIASNTFTVTAVITAGASRNYTEVALQITLNSHTYVICRDVFTAVPVSSGGTLTVTYTISFN